MEYSHETREKFIEPFVSIERSTMSTGEPKFMSIVLLILQASVCEPAQSS